MIKATFHLEKLKKGTNMQIDILAFGIAKDIVGGSQIRLDIAPDTTVSDLKQELSRRFPEFSKLASLRVAVNSEYADDRQSLKPSDEVVLIPPVSGG